MSIYEWVAVQSWNVWVHTRDTALFAGCRQMQEALRNMNPEAWRAVAVVLLKEWEDERHEDND